VKNSFSHNPVVIIGGGVAELTAANLLARDGFQVAICEAWQQAWRLLREYNARGLHVQRWCGVSGGHQRFGSRL
jgi:2-polyprenyl-6-methoxyphenol hydroxylase-like FAD-dependent oxidoreductase